MTDVIIPPGETPGTLDPIELALEAEAAQPSPDTPAALVLRRHAALLQRQIASETMGVASEALTLGLKGLAGIAGVAVAVLAGALVWDASTERGLVIEPFSTPPEFTERGYTGQVVASQMLDRLSEMQDSTGSSRAPDTYANNWNGDIKVQIPETGVSVGELRRLLVQWLGHQTSISGELYRTPDGRLALAARTGTAPAKTHLGADAELDALIAAAAEDVYAVTQPYRFAVYLDRKGDPVSRARSKALLQILTQTGEKEDRLWANAALSLALQGEGDFSGAARTATAAIELEPTFTHGWANRSIARLSIGHDEGALADARSALETARKHGDRFMRPEALAYHVPQSEASVAELTGDCGASMRAYAEALRQPGQEDWRWSLAAAQAACHDPAAARATRAEAPADPFVFTWQPPTVASSDMFVAVAREDWAGASRVAANLDLRTLPAGTRMYWTTTGLPRAALAKAKQGDLAGAQALIATTPIDCYACVRMRGAIASTGGDWAGADRWFTEAVRQGPSLPFAYAEWGESLAARGRYDAAIARFGEAAQRGPRWPDPLEQWGEALMNKGDYAGAVAKFAAADKLAPKWGRNHLRWGEALLKLGRVKDARTQLDKARALELSAADRATLARLAT